MNIATKNNLNLDNLTEGIDYYVNSKGLIVFTKTHLKKAGECCNCGCLHCPYPYRKNQAEAFTRI
ncbi:MAG: hypothetical protein JJU28_08900 [Cyclobacteriaceae bacterium]|nr:hypothetical protein [Cyclobacteriaceae bacterium]